MKKMILAVTVAVACSGQMCGVGGDTGPVNVCGREYYNSTYRVGFNPPEDATAQAAALSGSAVLHQEWTWNEVSPAIKIGLVVVQATGQNTLAQFRQIWLDAMNDNSDITILENQYVTLDSGQQGWLVSATNRTIPGEVSKFMVAVANGRMVYLGVPYPQTLTSQQLATIDAVLGSLCADGE